VNVACFSHTSLPSTRFETIPKILSFKIFGV
jgi:hypothetical protein